MLKSANDILEKIMSGDANDAEYWLKLNDEVDDFLETASQADIDILHNNLSIMESFNRIVFNHGGRPRAVKAK